MAIVLQAGLHPAQHAEVVPEVMVAIVVIAAATAAMNRVHTGRTLHQGAVAADPAVVQGHAGHRPVRR